MTSLSLHILYKGFAECPSGLVRGSLDPDCVAVEGESCQYSCNDGFSRNPAVKDLVCLKTGEWNVKLDNLCLGTPLNGHKTITYFEPVDYNTEYFIEIYFDLYCSPPTGIFRRVSFFSFTFYRKQYHAINIFS